MTKPELDELVNRTYPGNVGYRHKLEGNKLIIYVIMPFPINNISVTWRVCEDIG